jgi:hypothetical protein
LVFDRDDTGIGYSLTELKKPFDNLNVKCGWKKVGHEGNNSENCAYS